MLFWRHVSHIKAIILLDQGGYTETVVCKHSWLADVCIMLVFFFCLYFTQSRYERYKGYYYIGLGIQWHRH